jgi:hypothetical protein
MLPNDLERSGPARLLEEVGDEICDLLDAIYNIGSTVFIGICFIGPVNDQTFSYD